MLELDKKSQNQKGLGVGVSSNNWRTKLRFFSNLFDLGQLRLHISFIFQSDIKHLH